MPLDEAGKIQTLAREAAHELGLFTEFDDLIDVRLFQVDDSTYVLEITRGSAQAVRREREFLSPAQVAELRERIGAALRTEAPPPSLLDQSGRTRLALGSLALAVGYYGWSIPITLGMNDAKAIVASYLLIGGTGFFLPLELTRNREIRDGTSTFWFHMASRGILYGILFDSMLLEEPSNEDNELRQALGLGLLGSAVFGAAGYHLAQHNDWSAGTAEVIGRGGDFGLGYGAGIAYLQDASDGNTAAAMLVGSGAGLLAGHWLAGLQSYSRGDAYLLLPGGAIGSAIAITAAHLIGADESEDNVRAAMLGSLGGIAATHHLTRRRDFSSNQSIFITAGSIAGGLLGLGTAYLISTDSMSDDARENLYLAGTTLGLTGGFMAMHGALFNRAARPLAP